MKAHIKAIVLHFVCFILIFLGVHTLFTLYLNIENTIIVGVISAVFATILSPRRVVVNKQSGRDVYFRWVFSKKVIRFK